MCIQLRNGLVSCYHVSFNDPSIANCSKMESVDTYDTSLCGIAGVFYQESLLNTSKKSWNIMIITLVSRGAPVKVSTGKVAFGINGITVHSEFNLPNCKQENSFVAENHNMRSSIKSVIYIDTLYFNVRWSLNIR